MLLLFKIFFLKFYVYRVYGDKSTLPIHYHSLYYLSWVNHNIKLSMCVVVTLLLPYYYFVVVHLLILCYMQLLWNVLPLCCCFIITYQSCSLHLCRWWPPAPCHSIKSRATIRRLCRSYCHCLCRLSNLLW